MTAQIHPSTRRIHNPAYWTIHEWRYRYFLSPSEARVLEVFIRSDGFISAHEIATLVYGRRTLERLRDSGACAIIRTIQRLRKRIAPSPYTIRALNGVGYRLVKK